MQMVINRTPVDLNLHPGRVALDVLRDTLGLKGVKEGCREGDCGACTILLGQLCGEHVAYQAVVSCLLPIGDCAGKHLVTIEGLNPSPLPDHQESSVEPETPGRWTALPPLSLVQKAFLEQGAIQCGFCTPGLVVAIAGYLLSAESWDEEEAMLSIAGNICRCTGYAAIRRALRQLLVQLPAGNANNRVEKLIVSGFLPGYFRTVPAMLAQCTPAPAPLSDLQQLTGRTRRRSVQRRPSPESISFPDQPFLVAGGTDLYVQKTGQLESAPLELLSSRSELHTISITGNWCRIGGGITVEELRLAPELRRILPHLPEYLKLISSTQIRNRATLAGNLINASPIGDLTILLLALGAEVELSDGKRSRRVPLRSFYLGYKKMDRRADELLAAVHFPLPQSGDLFNFEKVGRRIHLDIASVNTACSVRMIDDTVEEMHLSAGGVAPIPLYLEKTCAYLRGRELDAASLAEALRVADSEISPISDVRGGADYKRLLLRQLIKAHFAGFFPERVRVLSI